MTPPVAIAASGAIVLGRSVVCDGFARDIPARVQTHVHLDHLAGFEASKGHQRILCSHETKALLCAKFNADLPYRANLIGLGRGQEFPIGDAVVALHPSQHMLGSVQVRLLFESGETLGYSGDFAWPCDDVIQVDTLVVDATYGSPSSVRDYSQGDAESALLSLTRELLNLGPVYVQAHQGTLQRAMQVFCGSVDAPMLATAPQIREAQVYREYGFVIPDVIDVAAPEGRSLQRSNESYLRFYGTGDHAPVVDGTASSVKLSAYMARRDDPVLMYTPRSYNVALSNHADFNGTLEYIRATGATKVLIDNSRGGKAQELSAAVRERLGVAASVPDLETTREWGRG